MLTTNNPLTNYFKSLHQENMIVNECAKNPTKHNLKVAKNRFQKQRQITDEHLKELYSNIPM